MLTAVLPAAVNNGVCIAISSRFLIPCGKAPITGCNRITAKRVPPVIRLRSPAYCFSASSKLIGSSLGNVFFVLGGVFISAGFGATPDTAATGVFGVAAGAGDVGREDVGLTVRVSGCADA